jgi:hypothetical protein
MHMHMHMHMRMHMRCGGRAVGVRWACGAPGMRGPVSLRIEELA